MLSSVQNAVMSSAASATMYTRPSQNSGAASSSARRRRTCSYRNAETACRRVGVVALIVLLPGGRAGGAVPPHPPRGSALDFLPGGRPLRVVGALDVGASVEALGDGGGPVPDLLGVLRVARVVRLAVVAEVARLLTGGRLTEVGGRRRVRLRAC